MNRTVMEIIWLPEGITFQDFKSVEGCNYTLIQFLTQSLVCGTILYFFRNLVVIPYLLSPIGKHLKIRSKPYAHPQPNEDLENLYKINRARPPRKNLLEAAKNTGFSERQVDRWLRHKALSQGMTTLDKFVSHGWTTFYYTLFTIFGLFVICSKDFFSNPDLGWAGVPFIKISPDLWWYCAIDFGFYMSEMVILFSQDRRQDFLQMFCHHLACLIIGITCITIGCFPLMALGIFLHELTDIPLGLAKMCDYAKKPHLSDPIFVSFVVSWTLSRLIAYPARVLLPTYRASATMGRNTWVGLIVAQSVSTVFSIFNVLWTVEILTAIKRKIAAKDQQFNDQRSSEEELSEDECVSSSTTKVMYDQDLNPQIVPFSRKRTQHPDEQRRG